MPGIDGSSTELKLSNSPRIRLAMKAPRTLPSPPTITALNANSSAITAKIILNGITALGIQPRRAATKTREEVVAEIARKELRIPTLEHCKSDRLDFHAVSVWGVQQALEALKLTAKFNYRIEGTQIRISN